MIKDYLKYGRKPFYAGIIIHKMIDQVVKGDWEPMVSQKDFLKINERLEQENTRGTYKREKEAIPRPLNGDLICGSCGSALVGYDKRKTPINGKPYYIQYYRCYKCNAVHINANSSANSKNKGIHNQFIEELQKVKMDKKYFSVLETFLKKVILNRNEDLKKEIKEDKKRLTELKKELETIEERFAFGKIPENLFDRFSEKLEIQILKLEQKIDKGNFSTANRSEKIKNIIKKSKTSMKCGFHATMLIKRDCKNTCFLTEWSLTQF